MSNLYWFKHDKNASFNDKMAELLNHEGSKGYGAYWYIIEMIYMQSRQKVHFNYLKSIERHGFSQSYMKKIITCYGLFVVEDDCFYPIISHSSLDNRTSKKTSNEPTTRQQPTHDEPTSEHFSMAENSSNSLIISKDTVTSSLSRATRVRTDKINIIIRKRKTDDDDDKSSLGQTLLKAGKTARQSWDDRHSKLGRQSVFFSKIYKAVCYIHTKTYLVLWQQTQLRI